LTINGSSCDLARRKQVAGRKMEEFLARKQTPAGRNSLFEERVMRLGIKQKFQSKSFLKLLAPSP